MPSFFGLFNRKQAEQEIGATVPLTYGLEQALYSDTTYLNFAKEGYGKNEIVHACIRELATSAANPRYMIEVPSVDGGMIELEKGDLPELLKNPTPSQDFYEWIELLITYLMVSGNVYVLKQRLKTTKIKSLFLLRPDRITINAGSEGPTSYTYEIGSSEYKIPADEIAHLSLPNPSEDLYGLSPLHVLARSVNLDLNMTDYAKVFFQNAGIPSGLLKIKRRLQSQEEASIIRSRWRSQFGGKNNFHHVAIMDDDAEYQAMASPMKDLALSELHNVTEARICSVFGVPPILIGANAGLERATYSNYREARFSFNAETLQPLIHKIVRFLNKHVASEFPNQGQFAVDQSSLTEMIDDKESNTTRALNLFDKGMITLNEARELVGISAVTDGDVRRIPSNILEIAEGQAPSAMPETLPIQPPPVEVETPSSIEPVKAMQNTLQVLPVPVIEKDAELAYRAIKLRRMLLLDREDIVDELAPQFNRYLVRLKNRVDGMLGRFAERSADLGETKDIPFNADELINPIEVNNLTEILFRTYEKITKRTFGTINESGIAGMLDWADNSPTVTSLLTQAPARAKMIHATSRKRVQNVLTTARERGYSLRQIVNGVPDEKFRGMKATLGETNVRATLIARTETMRTQNLTSLGYYKEREFEYVQATDPDGDAGDNYVDPGDPYGRTCIERNEQVYTITDASNINDHPNGTLAWMPMSRDYKPESADIDKPSDDIEPVEDTTPEFDLGAWQTPVKRSRGVSSSAAVQATQGMQQTARSLKGDLGIKMAQVLDEQQLAVVKGGKGFKSSEKGQVVGLYWHKADKIQIKVGYEKFATHHEIGHQLFEKEMWVQNPTGPGLLYRTRLHDFIGKAKADAFHTASKNEWNKVKKGTDNLLNAGIEDILPDGAITKYSTTKYAEFLAENFKYSITDPDRMKKVAPNMLKIMRKYIVNERPATWDMN